MLPSTPTSQTQQLQPQEPAVPGVSRVGTCSTHGVLLKYLSDGELREEITGTTNKLEAYNGFTGFTKWLSFGGEGVIGTPDPVEQEKRVKYTDLLANAVILQNTVDLTKAVHELAGSGYEVKREDLALLSPYWMSHIKRFGDYVLEWEELPPPLEEDLPLPV